MKGTAFIVALGLLLVASSAEFPSWRDSHDIGQHVWHIPVDAQKLTDNGGGWTCLGCTAVVYLIEQYSVSHATDIDTFISEHFCHMFNDSKLQSTCNAIEKIVGPKLVAALAEGVDPDDACGKVGLCSDSTCNLVDYHKQVDGVTFSENWEDYASRDTANGATVDGAMDWIKKLINRVFDKHLPLVDIDGDKHSSELGELRGFHWKGKDCDDLDANVYPGRKINPDETGDSDFNCNGIKGTDPDTHLTYEDQFCNGTDPMGVAVFGDSAGAHFEIPPNWFNATAWGPHVFDGALSKALDEFDIPFKSTYTGYVDSSDDSPVRSIYKYILGENKCNHRDFQNMGVNGGESDDYNNNLAFGRDQNTDHPVLIFLELVGNDVCGKSMTEPEDFNAGVTKMLQYLDTVAPAGSHVVLVGLADGRVLFDTLHDRLHPIGVKYPQFYDFLLCLDISPCYGWMNSDEDVRNNTFKRASELSGELSKISTTDTYNNFDMQFYPFPIAEIMANWVAEGKDPADLIEPVDGFHPGQFANALFADWLWEHLQADHVDWIPTANPNNDKITAMFGDQGGY